MKGYVDSEILEGFREEVEGYLPAMRAGLSRLGADSSGDGAVEQIHRLAHCIKGAASMVGLQAMSQAAGSIEDRLDHVTSGKFAWSVEIARELSQAVDKIEAELGSMDGRAMAAVIREADAPKGKKSRPTRFDEDSVTNDEAVTEEMLEVFQEEAGEHLTAIGEHLRELENNPAQLDRIEEARRSMHTLKGAAGMVGLMTASRLSHRAEDLLDRIRESRAQLTPEVIALMHATTDVLQDAAAGPERSTGFADAARAVFRRYDSVLLSQAGGEAVSPPEAKSADEAPANAAVVAEAEKQAQREDGLVTSDEAVSEEMLEVFQEECAEQLAVVAESLRALEKDPGQIDRVQEIRRSVHTLKGAAGMVGLMTASRVAHRSEDLLDRLYECKSRMTPEIAALLYATVDVLQDAAAGPQRSEGFAEAARAVFERYDVVLLAEEDAQEAEALGKAIAREMQGPLEARAAQAEAPEPEFTFELDEPSQSIEETAAVEAPVEQAAEVPIPEVEELPQVSATEPAAQIADTSVSEDQAISEEMLEVFQAEAEEHLAAVAEHLRELQSNPDQLDRVQEVRRSVHTLKGAAGIVGLMTASRLAHRSEDLLDRLYERQERVTPEIVALLYATVDALEDAASGPRRSAGFGAAVRELFARYDTVLLEGHTEPAAQPEPAKAIEKPVAPEPSERRAKATQQEPEKKTAPAAPKRAKSLSRIPEIRPTAPIFPALTETTEVKPAAHDRGPTQYARVPVDRLEELVQLVGELMVNRSALEQNYSRYQREIGEVNLSVERLRRLTGRLETEYTVGSLGGGSSRFAVRAKKDSAEHGDTGRNHGFDELEMDRYTDFHLITRDLGETSTDLSSSSNQLNRVAADLHSALLRVSRLTSEIQDRLMRARMSPLASIENRLHRAVRVTADGCGKLVDLRVNTGDVELDKNVLEELAGPLEHLLRNAVDHGIETAEERLAAGKPVRGLITLRAALDGPQAAIEIRDDGAGIDPEALRSKAVESGRFNQEQAGRLSNQELYQLLFQPGFSTADQVSEFSGRGVGLDVVRAAAARLNGSIAIDSTKGEGVAFLIRLPISMAVAKVLLVQSNGRTFAIPAHSVRHALRLDASLCGPGKTSVDVGGQILPAVRLAEALDLDGVPAPLDDRVPVLAVYAGEKAYALIVDRFEDARDVVVKGFGGLLRSAPGVAATTVLGDGEVMLILNPAELPEIAPATSAAVPDEPEIGAPPTRVPGRHIMVVDDSLSVRRVLAGVLKGAGWKATIAKDGAEAVEILEHLGERPDIMLVDVEMPRMDGFELTTHLRSQTRYDQMPIVMLTSRAGEKHREKAFELGATDYLVKPFQQDQLLDTLHWAVEQSRA